MMASCRQSVRMIAIIDVMPVDESGFSCLSEHSGNTLHNTRDKKNHLSALPLKTSVWLSGQSCIVCVMRLSFITDALISDDCSAVVPVPWKDKSVWEWLKCISTTKLPRRTLTVCIQPPRLAWASWLKPIDRPRESCHCRRALSAAWHHNPPLHPRGSLCLQL